MRYLQECEHDDVEVTFLASRCRELEQEAEQSGDMTLVDAPEGYDQLWNKALVFLRSQAEQRTGSREPSFVMHVDDDSFVRLDLLMLEVANWPQQRFYYGYIWDGNGNRKTHPIRNPLNKSHMPESQWPFDFYPPFASGCGFVLSWDLVLALVSQPLPNYRLLDPPFGIHLCGPPECCVLRDPIVPVHDERIRPYKPLPTFRADTLVQHYLTPEEMKPYYAQALGHASNKAASTTTIGELATPLSSPHGDAPQALYEQLVSLGIFRR
ncbi:galactosyltransferase-domain-containing protein [Dunaliella salina]|uniref:Hexosyltransferase n=1 Tax=Dunaliella salina TaxID=3046 RepID=A0ABQ7G3X7_DUNSA|nr:galactosyltransferase-domain-containing protein [Dunaliella salina]|eukprot:KAF5829312.1 galactosyltransferase-domain-containing protein [Dunaliella salina]